jgi:hypothetical protein
MREDIERAIEELLIARLIASEIFLDREVCEKVYFIDAQVASVVRSLEDAIDAFEYRQLFSEV